LQSLVGMSRTPLLPAAGLSVASSESARLTGLDFTQAFGFLRIECFAARNRWDATPNQDSTIRSITYSGQHDDSASQANRDRLREDIAGARLGFRTEKLRVNLNGYANGYDKTISSGATTPGFEGRSIQVISLDASSQITDYVLGLEAANSLGHGWAGSLDLTGDWERLQTRLMVSYLPKAFYSPHSRSRSMQ
jgi:hypothetical protein